MRAAIDIGSNTIQLLAGEVERGIVIPAARRLVTTRLGSNLKEGLLDAVSMGNTVKALLEMRLLLDGMNITEVRLVATSAVRDARNSESLLRRVKSVCGWDIEVLSGEREAFFSYTGAIGAAESVAGTMVLDIGGGSTEVIYPLDKELRLISANVGAVRAQAAGWSEARIAEELAGSISPVAVSRAVGVGGTVTTTAALLAGVSEYSRQAVQGRVAGYRQVFDLKERLARLTIAERCNYSPLLKDRGLVMLEGLNILISLMNILSLTEITASDSGILDGVLIGWENA